MNLNKQDTCNNIFVIDFVKVIACIGVIILHVNGSVWTFTYEKNWVLSWLIETLFYWPVPVFFMITGILSMNYREKYSTKIYIKKRVIKTVIPFIFWSIVSINWSIQVSHYLPEDTVITFRSLINMIINCSGMSIYWFFPALFAVYFSIPLLSAIEKNKRNNIYTYVAWFGFLTISFFPFIFAKLNIGFNLDFTSPICGGYILYVIVGYLIYYEYKTNKGIRIIIYLLGFLGWGIRFFAGLAESYKIGNVSQSYSGYLNLPCVMQSIAMFVFLLHLKLDRIPEKIKYLVNRLSKLNGGIYLVHFYIMRFIIDTFAIDMRFWGWKIGGVIITYLVSACIVWILKKIPYVRIILP